MGCGCGKRSSKPKKTLKSGPKVVKGQKNVSSGPSPTELRALGMQSSNSDDPKRMDHQRRRVEKLRREAIRRRFNK